MIRAIDIQRALKAAGFDPGPLDGAMGPKTRAAVIRFQHAHKLATDGIVGPRTAAVLFGPAADAARQIEPVWYGEARRRLGLHEKRDNSRLWAWLRSDGKTLGDPARNPWCGDFVATALALTLPGEAQPANPYLARNWLTFGRGIVPTLGAVMVFWRGSKAGTQGHVGFYVAEDEAAYVVLGGNQTDAVTDKARIAKERFLGARWPATHPLPTGGKILATGGGALSVNEA